MKKQIKQVKFVVKPFANPSGDAVWRVSGSLDGKQIRRNFKTERSAEDEAARLEVAAAFSDGRQRRVTTSLTPKQVKIAELLFDSAGSDEAVLALVGSVGGKIEAVPLSAAVSRFLSELERSGRREDYLRTQGYVLKAFARLVDGDLLSDVSEPVVQAFIFDPAIKPVTRADRKKRLHHFLKFCVLRGWLVRNFAEGLPPIQIERDLPGILSADELEALILEARDHVRMHRSGRPLDDSKGLMLGYFLCAAFTGCRPEEARKLVHADFHLDEELNCIEISPRIAKVSQCRQVEVLPELIPVLQGVLKTAKRRRVEPTVFIGRQFNLIREAAGVKDLWCNDVLRHTFASWHYALFKDVKRLTYTMGNSEAVLFQNYIRPMNARTARKYLEVIKCCL